MQTRMGPPGYWQGVPNSRAPSPGNDNGSETSSVMPAPVPGLAASRAAKDKYNHLSYWKARKVRKRVKTRNTIIDNINQTILLYFLLIILITL